MKTKQEIKEYIVGEFIPAGDINEIPNDLDLIASGIIDSLGILKLIAAIEQCNNLVINTEEMDFDRFTTVDSIYSFIDEKISN